MLFRWRECAGPTLFVLRRWRTPSEESDEADHLNNLACTRADVIGTLETRQERLACRVAFTT